MCLSGVDQRFVKPPKDKVFVGYKVMKRSCSVSDLWFGKYYGPTRGYKEGSWRVSKPSRIPFGYQMDYYPCGFHIYATRDAARQNCSGNYCVVKVEFANVVGKGWDDGHKTFIARRMRVIGKSR